MFKKQYDDGEFCPRIKDACVKRACRFWTNVRGRHPQTGEHVDRWDCADVWKIVLQIETTRETCSVGAAVESSRNEAIKSVGQLAQAIMQRPVVVSLPARDVPALLPRRGEE